MPVSTRQQGEPTDEGAWREGDVVKHEIGDLTAASVYVTRANLLTMAFGAVWRGDEALEALLDRVEMSSDVPPVRSARGVR